MIERETWATGSAGRLRLRWTLPKGEGPFPWLMYLQGYAAGSVAFYKDADDPLRSLLGELNEVGYATVRAEKRGLGGSEGPPAEDASFEEELDDYRSALRAVVAAEWCDPDFGVLFGHSLGALHAPRLAAECRSVRGVAVYGAGWLTWAEYSVAQRRRVLAMQGRDDDEIEERLRIQQRFDARVLQQGVDPERAVKGLERYRQWLGVDEHGRLHGRTGRYWREVQACPVARPLLALEVPVLAMWGSSDWLSERAEHVALVDAVNAKRPGQARFVEVPGADHAWRIHPTPLASMTSGWTGAYAPAVSDALIEWLDLVEER